jgi:UPF0755 protein
MKRWKKIVLVVLLILAIPGGFGAWWLYKAYFRAGTHVGDEKGVFYVHTGTTYDQLVDNLEAQHIIDSRKDFEFTAKLKKFEHPKAGRYRIRDGMTYRELINMFMAGLQEPVNITFNTVRTKQDLARQVSRYLECDSLELITLLEDNSFAGKYGFSGETFLTMFIPDTYEFYWNTTAEEFFTRMAEEYKSFWTDERKKKAADVGLTQSEVSTLASIVESEQRTHVEERKIIAGLYLNRLKQDMKLESDPTVIYAIGDFSINRVLKADLEYESPYNTYLHAGLPPGPILLPEKASIDAVLDHDDNDYIFMCAEYGTGLHNFTKDYNVHLENARKFRAALDKAGIKK